MDRIYKHIILERRGPAALLTLNNPATRNAMDEDLGPELVDALEGLAAGPEATPLVLTGAGGVFSAGGNIKKARTHLQEHPGQGAGVVFQTYTKWVYRAVLALTSMPGPVISAVVGAASGAGWAWMLASDLVVAARNAKILPGFIGVGLAPAAGVTLEAVRALGHARASEILMQNRPLDPEEALKLGLVNRLAPAGEVLPLALDLAGELARGPRQALSRTKLLLSQAARQGLAGQLEEERRRVMRAADDPGFPGRLEAFFNRARPPKNAGTEEETA